MDRREFLKMSGAGSLMFVAPRSLLAEQAIVANDMMYDPTTADGFLAPLAIPGGDGLFGAIDVDSPLDLSAVVDAARLFPGNPAGSQGSFWGYVARQGSKSYVNPTLRVSKGQQVSVQLANALAQPTIIHWHGQIIDGRNDGVPQQAIAPNHTYRYEFMVRNRAGTYWYHAHPFAFTSAQAFYGLAGYFLVEDEDERRLRSAVELELGENEIPLVIQDKRFDEQNRLVYLPDQSDWIRGYFGDRILLNATLKPRLSVERSIYRFRLLNGSNARIYRLAFVSIAGALPFHLIGNDGGFLPAAQVMNEAFLSPGERLDVLLDLSGLNDGEVVFLKSLRFDPMDQEAMGQMGMPMTRTAGAMPGGMRSRRAPPASAVSMVPNGAELYLLALDVSGTRRYSRVPTQLSQVDPIDTQAATRRVLPLMMEMVETPEGMMMAWTIDGNRFDPSEFPVQVNRNSVEIWEIRNAMMSMPHAMHIHGFQFQVLQRWRSPAQAIGRGPRGLLPTDGGWKDTVLTWPGETLRIAIDFSTPFAGPQEYVFHCHNLEHEDQGMMINYRVI